jgi:hypothetical protein
MGPCNVLSTNYVYDPATDKWDRQANDVDLASHSHATAEPSLVGSGASLPRLAVLGAEHEVDEDARDKLRDGVASLSQSFGLSAVGGNCIPSVARG